MQRNNPPEPHTPAWYALNPKRGKDDQPPGVTIDNGYCQICLVLLILIVVYRVQLRIKKQIENSYEKIRTKTKEAN
jgi:hypothetical protein